MDYECMEKKEIFKIASLPLIFALTSCKIPQPDCRVEINNVPRLVGGTVVVGYPTPSCNTNPSNVIIHDLGKNEIVGYTDGFRNNLPFVYAFDSNRDGRLDTIIKYCSIGNTYCKQSLSESLSNLELSDVNDLVSRLKN